MPVAGATGLGAVGSAASGVADRERVERACVVSARVAERSRAGGHLPARRPTSAALALRRVQPARVGRHGSRGEHVGQLAVAARASRLVARRGNPRCVLGERRRCREKQAGRRARRASSRASPRRGPAADARDLEPLADEPAQLRALLGVDRAGGAGRGPGPRSRSRSRAGPPRRRGAACRGRGSLDRAGLRTHPLARVLPQQLDPSAAGSRASASRPPSGISIGARDDRAGAGEPRRRPGRRAERDPAGVELTPALHAEQAGPRLTVRASRRSADTFRVAPSGAGDVDLGERRDLRVLDVLITSSTPLPARMSLPIWSSRSSSAPCGLAPRSIRPFVPLHHATRRTTRLSSWQRPSARPARDRSRGGPRTLRVTR